MNKYQFLTTTLLFIPFLVMGQQVGEMTMDMKEGEKIHQKRGYSPYAGRYFPTQVFWGDTHLHTSNSLDARAFGTVLGPEEAYRLARGEEITATHGEKIKLSRPLDWLVVADHSDGMGAMNEIIKGDPNLMSDATVKDWHERINQGGKEALMATMDVINSFALGNIPKVLIDEDFAQTVWDRYIKTAEKYNDPGRFTTIIGYEWTSTENGNNLHRNVLYRDNGDLARQMLPYTTTESFNPEDLWKWMEQYELKTKGNVLALAHNGNLSNGIMFPVEVNPATGKPLDADYMKDRIKWEPLYEITQIKGDGEAHPLLSPNDEFADYENWEKGNLNLSVAKTDDMLQYEYAREALKNGLKMEAKFGTNPYKFGVVGSTDSHTSLATAEEDNFFGKHSGNEPSAHRATGIVGEFEGNKIFDWELVASGYAGVWATENTREAIFDAMARKEVYATTGPRILVRFFGGWDFDSSDAKNRLPAETGYSKGVPMGGDLYKAPKGKVPTFLVGALKDPYGGNLDRIQIIKGWLDKSGKTHEKVYNVVWSDMDMRKADKNGKIPDVGNTVDVANATWSNTIGRAELISVWKDPDFDPKQRAFYYARVIEIPTPRWTAYDAKRFGVEMPKESPMTTTERAYTSPIWYTP
ncbi:DUF3604 domain-containing protein [Lutimonas saemankumensis]|uniref:DUF3604 domain-containing protein n=1 Tax=Lutimonas saemankumensis TaxID=483016 RepID=UPI001CD6857B|nr:DUF3604 domain-containing protein [Lutimonas saemankumensis]MCA0931660.1 DUF3604 domain-containing protein [Lutimonas saemankumensis]